jgi:hypothetical protein
MIPRQSKRHILAVWPYTPRTSTSFSEGDSVRILQAGRQSVVRIAKFTCTFNVTGWILAVLGFNLGCGGTGMPSPVTRGRKRIGSWANVRSCCTILVSKCRERRNSSVAKGRFPNCGEQSYLFTQRVYLFYFFGDR